MIMKMAADWQTMFVEAAGVLIWSKSWPFRGRT